MSSLLLSSEIIPHLLTLLRKACIALHSATVANPLQATAAEATAAAATAAAYVHNEI